MATIEQAVACGIVPVVVLEDAEQAVPTARALLKGGVNIMEITFRTAAAKASIAKVAAEVPEITVGAGTVINADQLRDAVRSGAQFIVCPGTDEALLREAQALDTPIVPGIVTPSEIMLGLKYGIRVFKFFPAEAYGGMKTIKALSGPFPQIRFIPTGGISQSNAAEYFRSPRVQAVGGSWMVPKDLIAAGDFDAITEKSLAATRLFREIRG